MSMREQFAGRATGQSDFAPGTRDAPPSITKHVWRLARRDVTDDNRTGRVWPSSVWSRAVSASVAGGQTPRTAVGVLAWRARLFVPGTTRSLRVDRVELDSAIGFAGEPVLAAVRHGARSTRRRRRRVRVARHPGAGARPWFQPGRVNGLSTAIDRRSTRRDPSAPPPTPACRVRGEVGAGPGRARGRRFKGARKWDRRPLRSARR